MTDAHKLFENWFREQYAFEMKRGLPLLKLDRDGEYVYPATRRDFLAFNAAIKILGGKK